ncbi:NAD(P)/FAD-dependent oxidoreductase [Amphibiibacter pelophylacis]|uniref:TIGR03862 family flavoprotein n=1 Tax=Amphibiibacter pelophylacis TaxID=1799477 RepID=A0ACC6P503_9BURK
MTGPRGRRLAIVGGGPAGLMAAQQALAAGLEVDLFEAKATVGRKFLLAGRGGLNLTHSEARPAFDARYSAGEDAHAPVSAVSRWLDALGPQAVQDWAQALGVATFVGSSGRVFPVEMKAAPLLRAWLAALRRAGLRLHPRHRWLGAQRDPAGSDGAWSLRLATPAGEVEHRADALLLALGGGSWPQLGSDGAWWPTLQAMGATLRPLSPSNCGLDVDTGQPSGPGWSAHLAQRHAGAALKSIALALPEAQDGPGRFWRGEAVITATGLEGPLVYRLGPQWRRRCAQPGRIGPDLWMDLLPDWSPDRVRQALSRGRGSKSWSSHLQSTLPLTAPKVALLFEILGRDLGRDEGRDGGQEGSAEAIARLGARIKALPLRVAGPRPLAEAISTEGGVALESLDEALMWPAQPGLFLAGEMLDWDAPTGGYLLTACLASGWVAGEGAARWLADRPVRA